MQEIVLIIGLIAYSIFIIQFIMSLVGYETDIDVDLDFDGNPYHFVEIKEIPSFLFCAKTAEKARENYKKQLKWTLQVMMESGEHIIEPGEEDDEPDWESLCP